MKALLIGLAMVAFSANVFANDPNTAAPKEENAAVTTPTTEGEKPAAPATEHPAGKKKGHGKKNKEAK